jgi:signal transduction histidine kinase
MFSGNGNIYMFIIAGMIFSFLTGIALILFYTRYHRRLSEEQEKISKAELEHQKELLRAVIQSQEDERKRIGQDLHDDAGSVLAKLRMLFNQIKPGLVSTDEVPEYKRINSLIDKAIDNVRNISHRLSPVTLEFFGFTDAIEELCITAHGSSGINIIIDNNAEKETDTISYLSSLHLFRIFEELITNTLKHAAARKIAIGFTSEKDNLICTYYDDGKGFSLNEPKQGMGLHNINSRIAMLRGFYTVKSSPGNGISALISVPLESYAVKNSSHGENKYSYSR